MKIVSLAYTKNPEYPDVDSWLYRIRAYMGVLENLSRYDTVDNIDRIGYTGDRVVNGVHHYFPAYDGRRLTVAWRLNRLVARLRPDVVLVHGMHFPVEVILLKWQLGKKARIIVQNHAEKPRHGYHGWLQRLADPCVDIYLFTAREMGGDWVDSRIIHRREKIREVMEASSVFGLAEQPAIPGSRDTAGRLDFLWVGRLDHNKDPLTVVKAFLRFAVLQPRARLSMIFHTVELLPEIQSLLDSHPDTKDNIILVGQQEHADMGKWYNAAHYIISGSHYEGSGIAVCEAMSCGCIPVLTDILSFRKMTADGACGILYQAGDPSSLLAALQEITGKETDKEKEKALLQFHSSLSFDVIAATIHDIAASLL